MNLTLNEDDYQKIGSFITELINPQKVFSTRIEWNNQADRFEIKSNQTAAKIQSPSSITLEKMISTFQLELHETAKRQKKQCPATLCHCKKGSILLYKYDLYEALLTHLQRKYPQLSEKLLIQEELKTDQISNLATFDQIILRELQDLYRGTITKYRLNSKEFNQCRKGNHNLTFAQVWQSVSRITTEGKRGKESDFPLYEIRRQSCKICQLLEFTVWKAQKTDPTKPFMKPKITYIQIETPVSQQWQALQQIFENAFPAGQARVIARTKMGTPLSSTDRTLKQQLRQKIQRMKSIIELWDDLEEFE